MTDYHEVTVYIMVDENGDHVAHHDPDCLSEEWENCIGSHTRNRTIELTLKVPGPTMDKASGEVPEGDNPTMTISAS